MSVAVATPVSETRVLSLIGIGHFLSHFYILCLPPMLPLLAREFNVGYALLGGAIAGYAWIGGILQAQIGAALDWIGARQMLAAGLAINAFAIAMIGFADTFWQFAALAVIAGVGNSVFHPVDYAIIAAKVVEKRLGRAYSLHTFAGFVGGGMAPITMVALAAALDWRAAFMIVGALGIVAALVIGAQGDALAGERVDKPVDGAASSRPVLLTAPVLLYFLFLATYGLASGGVGSQGVVAMTLMGLADETTAAQVLSAYQFAIAAGILAGGVFGIFILSGFGFGAVLPARDLMVRAITPPGASGRVFGFVFVGLSIGSGLAGVVFGALVDAGHHAWVFPIAGGLLVLAVIITTLAQIAAAKS
jgi:FSR family fosmidomycin resistance protein-like MFS transporter